jgi:predicted TPR repeat methyltransferase
MSEPAGELSVDEALRYALTLHQQGRVEAAHELYGRILAVAPDHADALHFRGVAAHQLEQPEEAVKLIRRALALAPEHADAHNNLGNVLSRQGAVDDAIVAYRRALELQPDHPHAHLNLAKALWKRKFLEAALVEVHKSLLAHPQNADAYRACGGMLYSLGRFDEAARIYARWLEIDPDNPVARHMAAATTGEAVPARASEAYVREVFDRFADSFDELLQTELQYRAPALIGEALARVLGASGTRDAALDAGCGTGLCAPLLRPYARRLIGVDLSPAMLQRAAARGGYDELVEAELCAHLRGRPGAYDLIASADTLCYFGDLRELLAAAAAASRPGAILVFTVERADEADAPAGHRINPHGRYSHTERYLREGLAAAGMVVLDLRGEALRMERQQPVPGLVVTARRP